MVRCMIPWPRTLGPNGKKCRVKGSVLLREKEKKDNSIDPHTPSSGLFHRRINLVFSLAYLQVEAPARHAQIFVDVTHTCVITDMQLPLRVHSTRPGTRSQDRGIVLYQFILDHDISFYFPLPYISLLHMIFLVTATFLTLVLSFTHFLITWSTNRTGCIVNESCRFIFLLRHL